MTHDLAAHAREIIDANLYLILGTVDSDGHIASDARFAAEECVVQTRDSVGSVWR